MIAFRALFCVIISAAGIIVLYFTYPLVSQDTRFYMTLAAILINSVCIWYPVDYTLSKNMRDAEKLRSIINDDRLT